MSITRRRLSPEESRDAALEAARTLLIEDGPQAVTLKAVAARIGRTHANLLHHFGSAAGLQKALAASIADSVTARIGDAVMRARSGDHDPGEVVDLTFDAFGKGGAGALASWMILTGNEDALDPILEAIHRWSTRSARVTIPNRCRSTRRRSSSCCSRSATRCSARRWLGRWGFPAKRRANWR